MAEPRPLEKPLTIEELRRFTGSIDRTGDCWVWLGGTASRGTPIFLVQSRSVSPRRLAFELEQGEPLDPRVKLMAACRNPLCVNPEHSVPKLGGGSLPAETCGRGHEFTEENTYITTQGKRACRKCIALKLRARRKRYRKEGRGWGRNYRSQKATGKRA